MQKEIIIQNSYNNIMNTYKKILLILVLVLITIIITIPFKKNKTIMSIYKDRKLVIETSSPSEIMSNNYLYINNIKCKYTIDSILEKQIILQISNPLQSFSENETIKLVLPIEEKPIIKYLYDYIRRTKW